jgi:hypothetical protein
METYPLQVISVQLAPLGLSQILQPGFVTQLLQREAGQTLSGMAGVLDVLLFPGHGPDATALPSGSALLPVEGWAYGGRSFTTFTSFT